MASLLRSAKSGNQWGSHELKAFNIVIHDVPVPVFFATQSLPPSSLTESMLWNVERNPPGAGLSEVESAFFQYMSDIEQKASLESAVDDLACCLLRIFGFLNEDRRTRQRPSMHFYMSGEKVNACANMTLANKESVLLLVEEDKRRRSSDNPEAQLISEFIAAYYENCEELRRVGREAPDQQVLLGITMVGTAPIFYRISVTEKLLKALERGSYPEEETIVFKFVPPVPNMSTYLIDGMRPLVNRRIIFQCFEGFKALLRA